MVGKQRLKPAVMAPRISKPKRLALVGEGSNNPGRVEVFPEEDDLAFAGSQVDGVVLMIRTPGRDHGGVRRELGNDCVLALNLADRWRGDAGVCHRVNEPG